MRGAWSGERWQRTGLRTEAVSENAGAWGNASSGAYAAPARVVCTEAIWKTMRIGHGEPGQVPNRNGCAINAKMGSRNQNII